MKKKFSSDLFVTLAGIVVPVLASLIAIPALHGALTSSEFGMAALAFSLYGIMGVMDFGVGKSISRNLAKCTDSSSGAIIKYGLFCAATISTLIVVVICLCLIGALKYYNVNGESVVRFTMIAICYPFVMIYNVFPACREGLLQFRKATTYRLIGGGIHFVVLGAVVSLTRNLDVGIVSVLLVRVLILIGALISWRSVIFSAPEVSMSIKESITSYIKKAWVTNFVGSLVGYLDRLVVASFLPVSQFSFYSIPLDFVSRTHVINGAISQIMFPRLSSQATGYKSGMYAWSFLLGVAIYLPIAATLTIFSRELVSWWISPEFYSNSKVAIDMIVLGTCFNAFSQLPYIGIMSDGRAATASKFHVLQLIIFLPISVLLIMNFGIEGAAASWFLRSTFDFLGLQLLLDRSKFSVKLLTISMLAVLSVVFIIWMLRRLDSSIYSFCIKVTFISLLLSFVAFIWIKPPLFIEKNREYEYVK